MKVKSVNEKQKLEENASAKNRWGKREATKRRAMDCTYILGRLVDSTPAANSST
jgi:hypothetical protein